MPTSDTFLIEQPWVILSYLLTEEEADANDGYSKIIFECCVCGVEEEKEFYLPPKHDPVWETVGPKGTAIRAVIAKKTTNVLFMNRMLINSSV